MENLRCVVDTVDNSGRNRMVLADLPMAERLWKGCGLMENLRFSDLEGLRIAAEMEQRGGEFYRRASRIAKDPRALALLNELAADEKAHELEFQKLFDQRALGREDEEEQYYSEEASLYLSAIAADIVFAGGLSGLAKDRGFENPAEILAYAIGSEKNSILFYSEMIVQARNQETRLAFQEIVRQEKFHLGKLQSMLMQQAKE